MRGGPRTLAAIGVGWLLPRILMMLAASPHWSGHSHLTPDLHWGPRYGHQIK
ncbi:uncharacterized protein SETTUDRAFT_162981 [Exserohilum turcica Et28A]|uniref:Uncharacterized protein n=1 Tax=Exserohilum turcicum (strain 28A) TaxID=671987 RepID=R0IQ48_EXST2|nr:uncharacterized protein SETTUDRAFT_162981 [Exserohilum turcica Et28A]EOA86851.1 hypothetical protein SETTUDRAFT_162981 [Exserohilum turcica Et28A]